MSTTYQIANTGAATAVDLFTDASGIVAIASTKGKAIDKARGALQQGADAGALLASATGAVRKTMCAAIGAESVAKLGQQVAHAAYGRAIATVAGAANFSFSLYVEPGKGASRADWLRLGAELAALRTARTAKGNPSPAAKMAERGYALHCDIQASADAIRAVADAARKAQSVNPEEMAQRALTQA